MKPWLILIAGILIGLFAAGIVVLVSSPPRGEPIQLPSQPPPIQWMVQVRGAVKNPGVYTLPVNSRLQDAIQAAGGLTEKANPAQVNLASILKDGQDIFVPEQGQPGLSSATLALEGDTLPKPVNINTATAEELDQLPGIGLQKAAEIVAYRAQHGLFQSPEEIQEVPGIGPAIFERIKNDITIDQP